MNFIKSLFTKSEDVKELVTFFWKIKLQVVKTAEPKIANTPNQTANEKRGDAKKMDEWKIHEKYCSYLHKTQ